MHSAIRHGAIMIALVGAVGIVAAYQSGSKNGPGLDMTTEITGSVGRSVGPEWI